MKEERLCYRDRFAIWEDDGQNDVGRNGGVLVAMNQGLIEVQDDGFVDYQL